MYDALMVGYMVPLSTADSTSRAVEVYTDQGAKSSVALDSHTAVQQYDKGAAALYVEGGAGQSP